MAFDSRAVREGQQIKLENKESGTLNAKSAGSAFTSPDQRLDYNNRRFAGDEMGSFLASLENDPVAQQQNIAFMERFAQSPPGKEFLGINEEMV